MLPILSTEKQELINTFKIYQETGSFIATAKELNLPAGEIMRRLGKGKALGLFSYNLTTKSEEVPPKRTKETFTNERLMAVYNLYQELPVEDVAKKIGEKSVSTVYNCLQEGKKRGLFTYTKKPALPRLPKEQILKDIEETGKIQAIMDKYSLSREVVKKTLIEYKIPYKDIARELKKKGVLKRNREAKKTQRLTKEQLLQELTQHRSVEIIAKNHDTSSSMMYALLKKHNIPTRKIIKNAN